jgi:hypothetical protein
MANQGLTMNEIAEQFVLPDSLGKEFSNRGYYGNLKHNVRATYQLYLGFWDGNPTNFDPLPPSEEAKKYVEMVGADKMIKPPRMSMLKTSTAGPPPRPTKWCSLTRKTRRLVPLRPTHWSRWGIRPSLALRVNSICPVPRNCAAA